MGLTNTVVNYSRQLNNTFDKFTSIAGGTLCLGRSLVSLIQNPGAALSGLLQIIAGPVMGSIMLFRSFLQYQLERILGSTFGVLFTAQQTILNIVQSIAFIFTTLLDTINGLTARAEYLRGLISNQENCQQIMSYMISCFINKTRGITSDKKLLRSLSNINNLDQSTLDILGDTFKQDDFNRFVDKYQNSAYKLQTQITKINRIL